MVTGGSQYVRFGETHYQRNKATYIATVRRRREEAKAYVLAIKKSGSCVDCGNSDFRVLEFDHLPEHIKVREISKRVLDGVSLKTLQEEIDKCELVCANCHRIRTGTRAGWF